MTEKSRAWGIWEDWRAGQWVTHWLTGKPLRYAIKAQAERRAYRLDRYSRHGRTHSARRFPTDE